MAPPRYDHPPPLLRQGTNLRIAQKPVMQMRRPRQTSQETLSVAFLEHGRQGSARTVKPK